MDSVTIFCSAGVAPPLTEAAARFERQREIPVTVVAGKAEALIRKATREKNADILVVGAEHAMDVAENDSVISKSSRRTIGYRRSALLVQKGNPTSITGLSDLAHEGVRISVSISGCLIGVWDDITAQLGITDAVRRKITVFADGCTPLMRTITLKEVDVAFGWNVFAVMHPATIEAVELPRELQIRRSTAAGIFTFAPHRAEAEDVLAYLRTDEARAIYRAYGWEL